jgi:5-histidylcysteine sulfoxide synthase/putative 4-mercaptohistidine N1-methyltranferase
MQKPCAIGSYANNDLFSRTPNLDFSNANELRKQLRNYFITTFDCYESLFECLASEQAYYVKPISLRHPLIFYLGHTATFFVNKMLLARLITERIDPRFESLFAVGVDEMSWDDLNDKHYVWPAPQAVKQYRDKVRKMVLNIIDTADLKLPLDWNNPWWSIIMGVEHERIHLETSSVLIRQHKVEFVKSSAHWQPWTPTESKNAPKNKLIAVAEGKVILGKSKTDPIYGWDNEYGYRESQISAFDASQFLVSNQEFLSFVEAGGYLNSHNWEDEGKQWLSYTKAQHPTFWIKKTTGWYLRLMTVEVPMHWDWPVEVNYHEAKAFCNWKKSETGLAVRLPTEDEWYRLYDVSGLNEINEKSSQANIHLDHCASSCPVDYFKQGDFYDVVGNVWQWTETPIYPFEGFEVHPLYDDFTTPTFDERHNLMKGGSWISCGNESLRSARYAFRRHFFQHAGFRYVISGEVKPVPSSHYETDKLLSEYAEFHYGDDYFGVPNFSKSLVNLAIKHLGHISKIKALDIGCASGRATFELAQHFEQVIGVDFSARFIGQGVALARGDSLRYTLMEEGDLVSYKSRSLTELGLDEIKNRVAFFQGDACNLKPELTGFDFVLAANLIDRLYDPAKFLMSIHERINAGGLLMITSPYTWLIEHTPHDQWLGGYKKDGENFTTFDGLQAALKLHFDLIAGPQEVPFVIRETKRKFQHTLSEVTLWQKK